MHLHSYVAEWWVMHQVIILRVRFCYRRTFQYTIMGLLAAELVVTLVAEAC